MSLNPAHSQEKIFARLAVRGVVTRAQLLAAGFSSDQVDHRLRTGYLHRIHAGVYAVGRPVDTPLQDAYAALLACGGRAALGGLTALALREVPNAVWPRNPVVVVAGARRNRAGVEVHQCSTLTPAEVKRYRGIAALTTERALLDLATSQPDQQLRRLVNGALRAKRSSRTKLREIIAGHPQHRGAKRLAPFAADPRNLPRSPFEDDFETFCIRYGLPTPVTNATPFGYEVDAYFPAERVIVELDGEEFHQDTFRSDRERDAHHLDHGVITIRLIWETIHAQPRRHAERLHRILAARRGRAA